MGDAQTNSIEGFRSPVKRGIGGVYHSVSRRHLQSYLDVFAFRYNRRDQGNLILCFDAGTGFRAGVLIARSTILVEVGPSKRRFTLCILGGRFGVGRHNPDSATLLDRSVV